MDREAFEHGLARRVLDLAGRTEPGLRTGLVDTVIFGRNEQAPQHLHRGVEAVLAAARG